MNENWMNHMIPKKVVTVETWVSCPIEKHLQKMQAVRRLIPTVTKYSTRLYVPARQFGGTCWFSSIIV